MDFEQIFPNQRNITSDRYKEVAGGGVVGWVGEGWAVGGGGLNPPLGLFVIVMNPRSAIDSNMLKEPKRQLTITGVNFKLMPSM